MHLFAAGRRTVHHWAQSAHGQPVAWRPVPGLPAPDGPVAAATAPDGTLELYYRRPTSKELTAVRIQGTAARSSSGPVFHGYGRTDAAGTPQGPVLLGRDLRGRMQLYVGGRRATRAHGVVPVGAASLHLGPQGALAVGIGADGYPWSWASHSDAA